TSNNERALRRRGGSCCHANSVCGTNLSAALGPITQAMMNWVLLVFGVMFGHPREVANKKPGNGSGRTPRLRGRGWTSEPCANNELPQPDTDEVSNLQRGHTRDRHQCDRPDIIRARNTGRDRADKCKTHHWNKNENLEPLTERDPSNKANDDE